MKIRNSYGVRHMLEMVRQFPGWLTIELYIEYVECAVRHEPVNEAKPLNYNRNEVKVEEKEDEGFDEEDDDKEDDGDDDEAECTDADDEEHFYDEDDDGNDDTDADDNNDNDDLMVRLIDGLSREMIPYVSNVSSQFKSVNIEEMQVN